MSDQKPLNGSFMAINGQGFILLEVLVAMSMILGVWIASVGIYHRLAFNLVKQESKRSQLRKEMDTFEIQEQVRANLDLSIKGLSNDTARVSDRNRSMRTATQSIIKNKR